MRSLVVDVSVHFNGASMRVLRLAEQMGRDAMAIAGLTDRPLCNEARSRGLRVHPVARHKANPALFFRLVRLVRDGGYDILDTQNAPSQFWGTLAAKATGKILVSTLNSWYREEYASSIRGRVYQALEKTTARDTDVFIAVSRDIRERLLSLGVPGEATVVVPNAVCIDTSRIPEGRAWLREEFGLPAEARIGAAVGRLVEAKGYSCLIDAMAMAKDRDLHCLIVGDGQLREALAVQAERQGVAARIRWLGFRAPEEALRIVKAADVFVMPSLSEGTPLALLEAAALGRPIVASRVGGIPEVVRDGEEGILVKPGDPAALADGLQRMWRDPAGAARMAQGARRRVDRDFSLAAQAEATRRAYALASERARIRRRR